MSDCNIDIVLEDDQRAFEPGDNLVGKVRVQADRDCQCEQLRICRQWIASGYGEAYRGGDDEIVLYEGKWKGGKTYEYPFIFHAPPGPYSYEGELLDVSWVLAAQAELDELEGAEAETSFAVEPSGDEAEFIVGEEAATGERDAAPSALETLVEGIGGLMLVAAGLWLIYPSVAATPEASVWTLLAGLGSLGAGAWLLNRIFRRRRQRQDAEPEPTSATDYQVEPGDHVSFVVELEPNFRTTPKGVTALLKGYEQVRPVENGAGKADLHRFYEEPISIEPTDQNALAQGQPSAFRVDFRVPDDAPFSFHCPAAEVGWAIEVHVDVGSWPDWSRDFPLVVRPCVGHGRSTARTTTGERNRYG